MDKIVITKAYVQDLSNDKLLELCNDIYEKETGNGDFNKEGALYQLVQNSVKSYGNYDLLVTLIKTEADNRYHNVAKLLFYSYPKRFLS